MRMYVFYPQLLLRTPACSYRAYDAKALPELLKSDFFQVAIQLASQSLYEELSKHNFELQALPPRTLSAVKKYLNRMCFRPTPFGLFSAVSLVSWQQDEKEIILGKAKPHAAFSFSHTLEKAAALLANDLDSHQILSTNSTCYKVHRDYRYVRYEQDQLEGRRHFFIETVGADTLLTALLSYCRQARPKEDILDFIAETSGAAVEECAAYLQQLVDQQLLLSDLQPNITGIDYLHRLWQLCQEKGLVSPSMLQLGEELEKLAAVRREGGIRGLQGLLLEKQPLYVNLERQVLKGGLPAKTQQEILRALEALRRLLPDREIPALQRFREAFTRKFDRQAIPLLEALDPELGVGYEELAGSFQASRLLQGVEFDKPTAGNKGIAWTPAHTLLLDKWHTATGIPAVLQLEETEVMRLPVSAGVLPPGTSVLFRMLEDQVYLEHAGGISAVALLGRFTPLQTGIEEMAATLARLEQQANPDVVFAEIAHLCDSHTANIDRRCNVREYEIPILVKSGTTPENQIPVQDLMVTLEGDQVLLWSRRLQKRVIPRLGSAFNFTRDDLAVFRFLCDLQYQGLQSNFSLDLSSFFPDLSFYPRVTYGHTILSLASWHLKAEDMEEILQTSRGQQVNLLRQKAATLAWPRHVALTVHDHQLVIDLDNADEVHLLLENVKQKSMIIVKEYPFINHNHEMVKDEAGQPYAHQFLAPLYLKRQVYQGLHPGMIQGKKPKGKRKFLPGDEWLYLKFYCHPARANEVLANWLLPALQQTERQGKVKQWFFIRYQDPDYHLRVRLQFKEGQADGLLVALSNVAEKMMRRGLVQDMQLAVYERELERYGADLMAAVEEVFCSSSTLTSRFLQATRLQESSYDYYRFAFQTSDMLLDAFSLSFNEKASLMESLYLSFYHEHGGTKALREQLSRKFRQISREENILPVAEGNSLGLGFRGNKKCIDSFLKSLQLLANKATLYSDDRKQQLIADLLHMHLNRLLVDQARRQELIIYYSLWKHYQSVLARQKAPVQV